MRYTMDRGCFIIIVLQSPKAKCPRSHVSIDFEQGLASLQSAHNVDPVLLLIAPTYLGSVLKQFLLEVACEHLIVEPPISVLDGLSTLPHFKWWLHTYCSPHKLLFTLLSEIVSYYVRTH
jgi:hypothetical protein